MLQMRWQDIRSRLMLPVAILAAGSTAACENLNRLLEVENPGVIGEIALQDTAMIPAMVNSVVGEFQLVYDNLVIAGAVLGDEAVNGHNFDQWKQIDLRNVDRMNSQLGTEIYNPLQRARGAGDAYAERIRELLGAGADSHFGYARVLAYAGYSYVMLGEFFCESPVNPTQPALTSRQIMEKAIEHFEGSIQVATAARAAGTPAARADSIINMARVGAARAHLWLGNKAQAVQFASQVPANFQMWVAYGTVTALPNNWLQQWTAAGTNMYMGIDGSFRGLNDPRVRHAATAVKGHNGVTDLFRIFQGINHSEYSATSNVGFGLGTNIRFSSGLEAQYIVAEAQGLNAANLAFINARRAVGGMAALDLATTNEAQFQAALRDQRRRDFFLSGHRLGDLRRYITQYNLDLFPKGTHPNADWGPYGTSTCFVPHNNERVGNPAYR
jgi:hypothetical protein